MRPSWYFLLEWKRIPRLTALVEERRTRSPALVLTTASRWYSPPSSAALCRERKRNEMLAKREKENDSWLADGVISCLSAYKACHWLIRCKKKKEFNFIINFFFKKENGSRPCRNPFMRGSWDLLFFFGSIRRSLNRGIRAKKFATCNSQNNRKATLRMK